MASGLLIAALSAMAVMAGVPAARAGDDLSAYHWKKRLLLVFAPDREDPTLARQDRELTAHDGGVRERDLVVFHIVGADGVSRDGSPDQWVSNAALRGSFAAPTEAFLAVLIGKDGTEKLRSADAVPMADLFALIDAMPMRRREMMADEVGDDPAAQ